MFENIDLLIGKVLKEIKIDKEYNEIEFHCYNGDVYRMFHSPDCCESVTIEDVCGEIENLLNSPIIMAEEVTNSEKPKDEWDESFTWTFYKLATVKGYVTIRWYGTSNGYYSESVDFEFIPQRRVDEWQ